MNDTDWATRRDSRGRLWAGPVKASKPTAYDSILLGLLLGLILAWLFL